MNPAGTSRTCARCGHCAKDNRLTQASFVCTACGHAAHADVNAAVNIHRAGLALRQAAQAAQREAAPSRERRSHNSPSNATVRSIYCPPVRRAAARPPPA
ncbi:zinc ribbon domain-containing protein [Nonomuraea sp. NPDC049421]|uniref:zinc ribbon domain-containing protein n=1 Tax=Nonomuraea sp. NPDC049421 TaxID=3155275 RepID=UPI00343C711E